MLSLIPADKKVFVVFNGDAVYLQNILTAVFKKN